ncbi:M20 family metallopeptidase [Cytobacillus sp. S13-E01]|uniref:M20 family metallopeptidase n=1 Tax=Cytobacillus sp. S13-E01 TaxID=3031326 RepID=UPI0023D8B8AA|nr:M20 family metallopeptidase [Cytobacillus sp. S13-E01]MDF0725703.1 M20 family metallopeptidase [Cytobacillus sp. S13-E01]
MKVKIIEQINHYSQDFYRISKFIGENPELGHEEFKSSEILANELKKHNFEVTLGTAGLPTAFEAVFDSGLPGPTIGYMAEYDALPEIGHACGHNLIGTMAAAAGIGLSKVLHECGGKVIVFGTPAEETKGGKVTMAELGLFDQLDVAMMVHPLNRHEKSGKSLAMDAIQFEFFGKSAHAAASPHDGINALDAVIQVFNSMNALRQHIKPDARVHGIIPEGGKAANIVPDYAVAQFYVRANERSYVNELVERLKKIAEGAALATGCAVESSFYEFSYDNMVTNENLSNAFSNSLLALGIEKGDINEKNSGSGSLDMGNVSQVVPSIHPYIQICTEPYACHTNEFREAAMSEKAQESMILGAKAMALTGLDVLTNPELLLQIKQEFKKNLN